MVSVIAVLAVITIASGVCIGAFMRLSYAIRWEDRRRGSLRFDAPSASTRTARTFVGFGGFGWE